MVGGGGGGGGGWVGERDCLRLLCSRSSSEVRKIKGDINTVEPLNNAHFRTSHFVLYREVVLSSEVKMY